TTSSLLLGLLLGGVALYAPGCVPCTDLLTCPNYADAGINPNCMGDPNSMNIVDECGVFVRADASSSSSSSSSDDGTIASPLAKLADAIAKAANTGKRVYACTSKAFSEAVTISARVEVYGGFDCTSTTVNRTNSWAWSPNA